jgi:hypothetical protein
MVQQYRQRRQINRGKSASPVQRFGQRSVRIYGLRSVTCFNSGATSILWATLVRLRLALSGLPTNAHMIIPIASVAPLITPMSRFIANSRIASGVHKSSQLLMVEVRLMEDGPVYPGNVIA